MKRIHVFAVASMFALAITSSSYARGGGHRGGAAAPGTGSNPSSTHVHGYLKKDGTYVPPHERSTPDRRFENNWTTKGNENLVTGKDGGRVSEPQKR